MNTSGTANTLQSEVYLKWVNAQLKKKPGTAPLNDLCTGMHDGTAFADLIEVVAGERIIEVIVSDKLTREQKLHNVSAVIQYMKSRHIRMHETLPEDIVNGQLKSIMRLTLVLAAHYKPSAVKPNSKVFGSGSRSNGNLSLIQYAQDAALHLADTRREASEVRHRPARPPPSQESKDYHSLNQPTSSHFTGQSYLHHQSSPSTKSPQTLIKNSSVQEVTSGGLAAAEERYQHLSRLYEELNQDHESLKQVSNAQQQICEDSLEEAAALRKALVALQKMFLEPADDSTSMLAGDYSISHTDDDENMDEIGDLNDITMERLSPTSSILMRSRVQQLEEQCRELRQEVSGSKSEYHRSLGTEAGLQQRLRDQEGEGFRLREELIKIRRNCEALECRNTDLENRLREQDDTLIQLRAAMRAKEDEITRISAILSTVQSGTAENLDQHGNTIYTAESGHSSTNISPNLRNLVKNIENHDVKVIKQSMDNLRVTLSNASLCSNDFIRLEHCIDSLVQGINSLSKDLSVVAADVQCSSLKSTKLDKINQHDINEAELCVTNGAKVVLYFGEEQLPATSRIDKRLSEIRLLDIKKLVDSIAERRCCKCRYYFRTKDKEYGLVKEEISCDDSVVPHWDDTIMVWVMDDTHIK